MLQAVVALAIKHHAVPFIYIMLFTFEGFFFRCSFFPTIKKKLKWSWQLLDAVLLKKKTTKNQQNSNGMGLTQLDVGTLTWATPDT